ncbi:MAG: hypothetical protein K6E19_08650 [Lachnospiraceae bacterium]|nr:hypothetical protein [Lachnospiraceae bacterium]
MTVNGITNTSEVYSSYKSKDNTEVAGQAKAAEKSATDKLKEDSGVVYEPTLEMPTKTYKANEEIISKLKLDAQNRMEQLQNIVTQLISKQADASGKATDIWGFLREGKFTVDPETKAQAQADIAEDGYWGVKQTSDRIIDFAMALTGGDPSKVETMRDAFKKGFEQAEKAWGGKLPDISQRTYDEVMKRFDELAEPAETEATPQ